jgi:TctA family transporter
VLLDNVLLGLSTALSWVNLWYCFVGVSIGMLTGIVPGFSALTAISMLFPLTFYLSPTTALIMLGGIWYGAGYGGRITAILLNIPGEPLHAVMCQDGYPMARQGRAGIALLMTTTSAFIGGSIGICLLMFFGPVVAEFALRFGAGDYFAIMVFGLVIASTISEGSAIKGLAMVVLGAMFGCVGTNIYTGVPRFTFGVDDMTKSLSLVALAMGIYGVAEVIVSVREVATSTFDLSKVKVSPSMPSRDDLRRTWAPALRGSGIGAFFGTLPGAGTLVAAFLSYAIEKRVAREPQRFGKGAMEGIVAPEAAGNAAEMTGFIPTLTLGIPSTPSMVLMAGALIIQGITPGPSLMKDHPDLFWGTVMSFWIGNVMLVVMNVPLVSIWVKLLQIPYHYLFPSILVFICAGSYVSEFSSFDIWMIVFFGVLGLLMRIGEFPAAPMLLGFVLTPLMEDYLRRAMLLADGDFLSLFQRPVAGTFLALTVALIPLIVWSTLREKRLVDEAAGLAEAKGVP